MLLYPTIVPHPADDEDMDVAGELTAWYFAAGDKVIAGQILYQITWPGIAVDYSAEVSGTLRSQQIKLRQMVRPGDVVGVIMDHPAE